MSFSQTLAPFLTADKDESHLKFNENMGSALERFLADAQAAGHSIQIYSGYRSPERQAQLYADALKKYGSPQAARKWVAPPGRSQHNFGNAADLRYGSDEAKAWAHSNASKYGLNFRMPHEPWHIEFAGGSPNAMASAMLNQTTPSTDAPDTVSASEDAAPASDNYNEDVSNEMSTRYSAYMMRDNPYQDSRRTLTQTSDPVAVQTVSMEAYSTPDPFKSQGIRFSLPFMQTG